MLVTDQTASVTCIQWSHMLAPTLGALTQSRAHRRPLVSSKEVISKENLTIAQKFS